MRRGQDASSQAAAQIVLATASYDHTVKFWEVHSGKAWLSIKMETQINAMALSPDRENLALAGNPNIAIYDYKKDVSAPLLSYTGHQGNVTAVGYQKDGQWLYSASEDKTVKIWDARALGAQREMENPSAVNTAALHPNQVELIYGDQSGSLKVWDLRTNTCTRALVPSGKIEVPLRSIAIADNGKRVVAANNKGQCFVWRLSGEDTTVFEPYTKVDAHSTYVTSVRISPDCKLVATTSADGTCKIFDMKAFRQVQILQGHDDWIWSCEFSADSSLLCTCSSDSTARLWNLSNGECVREYEGHAKTISAMVLGDRVKTAAAPSQ